MSAMMTEQDLITKASFKFHSVAFGIPNILPDLRGQHNVASVLQHWWIEQVFRQTVSTLLTDSSLAAGGQEPVSELEICLPYFLCLSNMPLLAAKLYTCSNICNAYYHILQPCKRGIF